MMLFIMLSRIVCTEAVRKRVANGQWPTYNMSLDASGDAAHFHHDAVVLRCARP